MGPWTFLEKRNCHDCHKPSAASPSFRLCGRKRKKRKGFAEARFDEIRVLLTISTPIDLEVRQHLTSMTLSVSRKKIMMRSCDGQSLFLSFR